VLQLHGTERWSIYGLLIAITAGIAVARIMRLDSPDTKSPTPFLSANDRSRWATIRSLGDQGTYVLDDVIFDARGNRARGWHTIDLVRHRGADGKEHYYSSKPTLLTTLLAGEYWVIKQLTGATLAEQPHYVSRLMLVLTNVLPLAGALLLLARLIDRLGTTDWGRILAVAAACFGTFLTTFAVTLNNHVTAAISLMAGLAAVVPIVGDRCREAWRFAVVGLSLGFLAANELPALALLALVGAYLLWQAPRPTMFAFAPAALAVAAAAFGTNFAAHGDWRTPYAHRHDGPVLGLLADDLAVPLNAGELPPAVPQALAKLGLTISDRARIEQRERGERWLLWDEPTRTELVLQRTLEGERNGGIRVQRVDNWYDYEGSYWQPKNLRGIDRGEPSPAVYAFHLLLGHHGLLSLTPLWLLSAAGCWFWLAASSRRGPPDAPLEIGRLLAATTVLITLILIAFYLTRPQIDRNYGGATCCLRWLLWLTPLWLLTLLPAADRLSHGRAGRGLALALLLVSVFSAHYAADNPWTHSWLFDYWTAMGWIKY
jgi:hypothetical protein